MKLADFIPRLEAVATAGNLDNMKRTVATSCLIEVDKCFRSESDPYGSHWAPRKVDVPWSILYKGGALNNSFVAYPTSTGIHFESSSVYAARQNYGGGGITARNMLPSSSRGLPGSWLAVVRDAFTGAVANQLAAA